MMNQLSSAQTYPEVIINENFGTLDHQAVYGNDPAETLALTWGYYGGRWGGFAVAAGTFTLTNNSANYIVVEIATGATTCGTTTTNWNDTTNYVRVYKLTTVNGVVTATEDHRSGPGGVHGGTGTGGGSGGATGLEYTASSTTTDSDPGIGTLRWDNATQASATTLYIDNADGDSTSLVTLWAGLAAGSFLTITEATDADVWQVWKVTATPVNGTGYYKFPVTLQAQEGGNITNGTSILLDVDAGGLADGDKGDITVSAAGATWTIDNDVVTNAKAADVATATFKGRTTAGTGDPEDLSVADAAALLGQAIKPTECIFIACSDESTPLTTGSAKATFRMPYAFTVTDIRASVTTAPTGGTLLAVDVNESGTTILSTKLTFDASEKTTTTATTPRVISDASLADDAEITVDIDAVGSTVAGTGLKVAIIGHRT